MGPYPRVKSNFENNSSVSKVQVMLYIWYHHQQNIVIQSLSPKTFLCSCLVQNVFFVLAIPSLNLGQILLPKLMIILVSSMIRFSPNLVADFGNIKSNSSVAAANYPFKVLCHSTLLSNLDHFFLPKFWYLVWFDPLQTLKQILATLKAFLFRCGWIPLKFSRCLPAQSLSCSSLLPAWGQEVLPEHSDVIMGET